EIPAVYLSGYGRFIGTLQPAPAKNVSLRRGEDPPLRGPRRGVPTVPGGGGGPAGPPAGAAGAGAAGGGRRAPGGPGLARRRRRGAGTRRRRGTWRSCCGGWTG